jgi:secondary thiamine-phosphate synthase enzyme
MKIIQQQFSVSTKSRCQMIDITSRVQSMVSASGITDGDAIVFCPHTTAAITINENADPSVPHDILLTLEQLLPQHRY